MNHNTRVPEPWDGYENYPTCSSRSDAYKFDFEAYRQQLKDQSSWIFANDEADISVRVIHNDGGWGDAVVKTRQDLEAQIRCFNSPKSQTTAFFCLRPVGHGWSSLAITEALTCKLLTTYRVHPSFIDCLHAAAAKICDTDSTPTGSMFHLALNRVTNKALSWEISYNYSYIVLNNREKEGLQRWSIRSTSVYQQHRCSDEVDIWILLKAAKSVQDRISLALNDSQLDDDDTDDQYGRSPLHTHLAFLSHASQNWRAYYNEMEQQFSNKTYAALEHDIDSTMSFIKPNDDPIKHLASRQSTFSSNTQGLTNNTDDKDVAFATISPSGHDSRGVGLKHRKKRQLQVKFEDIQRLQKFFEDIINFKRHLERNERSLQLLKDLNNRYHKCIPRTPASEADHATFNDDINLHFADIETHRRNLNSLQRRAEGRSRLMYNVLEFQTHEAVARHGEKSNRLQEFLAIQSDQTRAFQKTSQHQITLSGELSKRATEEAVIVRILTVVALFYIPITFAASFLDAGILTFKDSTMKGNGIDWSLVKFSRESCLIFCILSIFLLFITFSASYLWKLYEARSVKRERKRRSVNDSSGIQIQKVYA